MSWAAASHQTRKKTQRSPTARLVFLATLALAWSYILIICARVNIAARCFHLSRHVAICCVSAHLWKKSRRIPKLWHVSPPNEIIFTSLRCHGIISSLNKSKGGDTAVRAHQDIECTCACTDVLFLPRPTTHTYCWRVLLTLAGIPCPSMSHRALLLGAVCALRPMWHVFHLKNQANCLCMDRWRWRQCMSVYVCVSELKAFGDWMQAAVNPVLD